MKSSSSMADKMLSSRSLRLGKIKLLGDMGDTREALRLADSHAAQVRDQPKAKDGRRSAHAR